MSAPCMTCHVSLHPRDIDAGLRCLGCTTAPLCGCGCGRERDAVVREVATLCGVSLDEADEIVSRSDAGSTTVALLLAALWMLGFVGLVLVGQGVVCEAQDTARSYCEAGR